MSDVMSVRLWLEGVRVLGVPVDDPERLEVEVAFLEPRDDGWVREGPDPEELERTLREGLAAVAEYESEFGAFTEEEKAWSKKILDEFGIGSTR